MSEPADQPAGQPAGQPPSAPGSGRTLVVLASGFAILVLTGAVVAPLVARAAGFEPDTLTLAGVRTYEIEDRTHTRGDVDYPQNPPAGGQHDPVWLDCGAYDVPVREENAVHDLEHGTVWITYDPALPSADVQRLVDALPDNGILSPREDLPAPVVVTVWGNQLALGGAADKRLGLFLAEYGDGHTAPELGASCHGGTPDPLGGVPGVNA